MFFFFLLQLIILQGNQNVPFVMKHHKVLIFFKNSNFCNKNKTIVIKCLIRKKWPNQPIYTVLELLLKKNKKK